MRDLRDSPRCAPREGGPRWRVGRWCDAGREFFERLLEQREREGLSHPALSKRSGVPPSILQRWGRRLAVERAEVPARSPFVEVTPATAEPPAGCVKVLLRSGHMLFLDPGPPSEGLAKLVTLLETC